MMNSSFRSLALTFTLAAIVTACSSPTTSNPEPSKNQVGSSGGTVSLEGVATVEFPVNAFSNTQAVNIAVTNDVQTQKAFEQTASLFAFQGVPASEVRILVGTEQPASPVQVQLKIPSSVSSGPGFEPEAFYELYQYTDDAQLDSFVPADSQFDSATKTLSLTLPEEAFSNDWRPDGKYEAVLMISTVENRPVASSVSSQATQSSNCAGSPLQSPLHGPLNVRSKFGRRTHPITGKKTGHGGVDLRANTGDKVRAVADGEIIAVGNDTRVKNGKTVGWGEYIQLKTDSGIAVYGHLNKGKNNVKPGDMVSAGDDIAEADNSGGSTGPHLHLEYAASRGLKKYKKSKLIDPLPCINSNVTGTWVSGSIVTPSQGIIESHTMKIQDNGGSLSGTWVTVTYNPNSSGKETVTFNFTLQGSLDSTNKAKIDFTFVNCTVSPPDSGLLCFDGPGSAEGIFNDNNFEVTVPGRAEKINLTRQ